MDSYDVIVLGLGGMGSAAAAHLAARGATVLGLEQFTPVHDRGSSHGDTRIIRQAYFEDPAYVPLLIRSYELYEELNTQDPGLLVQTGGLMMGTADSPPVIGSAASARTWNLPYEMLDAKEISRRFPNFTPTRDTVAFYEERGGFVRPERTVRAHLRRAATSGATLHFEEPVLQWSAHSNGVRVRTKKAEYSGEHLVITAGAWAPKALADLALPLTIERQLLFWFDPPAGIDAFQPGCQPIFIWEAANRHQLYGFPAVNGPEGGVKFAFYRNGAPTDPDQLDRQLHPEEITFMREHLALTLPNANGKFLRGQACLYTLTPDLNFIIGNHPYHPTVTIAAGFSGHGFKFVPVIGEILADLVMTGTTNHPIALFNPGRFR